MKRVGIIFPGEYLDSIPCVVNTIILFAKNRFKVTILCFSPEKYTDPRVAQPNIEFIFIRSENALISSLLSINLLKMAIFAIFSINYVLKRDFDYILGIEPIGLIIGVLIAKIRRISAIYFSLELLFFQEINSFRLKIIKLLERISNKKCALTIIQDKTRGYLLSQENGINLTSIVTIPNAPLGNAHFGKKDFLHQELGIPKEKFLVLYQGTVAKWAYSIELAYVSKELDSDNVLVLHSRNRPQNDEYLRKLKEISKSSEKLFLSFNPVEYSRLEDVVRSADIGLAFYKTSNNPYLMTNIRAMGLSSGKVAHFLKAGIPIIVNSKTNLRYIVQRFECGIVVEKVTQLGEAILKIKGNYEYYSKNACRCFRSIFDFENRFNKFLDKLNNL